MSEKQCLILVSAALLFLGGVNVLAQGNGGGFGFGGGGGGLNLDPAQRQQQRMNSLREQMAIMDDDDWKVTQPLIQKVMDAQQVVQRDQVRDVLGVNSAAGSALADRINQALQRVQDSGNSRLQQLVQNNQGAITNFTSASPEAQALRAAVQSNTSSEEIQAALARYQKACKDHQFALEKAQADLRQVITIKQEAVATMRGLL
jgi:hypothetical protein